MSARRSLTVNPWRVWLLVAVACWAAVAPAFATAFVPGFNVRGPENRVWNFFPRSVETRQENHSQVADSHLEKVGHGYEVVSGVHVYLYGDGNPLSFSDPSGNMSLGELMLTTGAIGTLTGMAIGGVDAHLSGRNVADGVINGALVGGVGGVLSVVPGLGPVILTAGSFMGGWSIGSAINEGNASLAAFRAVTTFGAFGLTRINGIGKFKIPLGLKDEATFFKFGVKLSAGLKRAGYSDATSYMRGSSVTGSGAKGPFDVGRTSDYDLSITSEALLARAKQLGIQLRGRDNVLTRTGPLNQEELSLLGLAEMVNELSAEAGRNVSIMIYEDASWIAARGDEFLGID